MNKYTDKMIADMKAIGTFNYDSAKAFADANGLTFPSVIAKVRALELDYQPKDLKAVKVAKAKARSKADIVNAINANLESDLASLNKMTIVDLEVLETVLKEREVA
jgi:hypothetical protein